MLNIPEIGLIQPEESFHLRAQAPGVSTPVRESISIDQRLTFFFYYKRQDAENHTLIESQV